MANDATEKIRHIRQLVARETNNLQEADTRDEQLQPQHLNHENKPSYENQITSASGCQWIHNFSIGNLSFCVGTDGPFATASGLPFSANYADSANAGNGFNSRFDEADGGDVPEDDEK